MAPRTKRVPKSRLKWIYELSVPQLVYAARSLTIAHEGFEKAQLIEAIVSHKRVGRLKQCDVTERRLTWDEVWKKIDWEEWERGWCWGYREGSRNLPWLINGSIEHGLDLPIYEPWPGYAAGLVRDGADEKWQGERDALKSKKLYAKSLGHSWAHPMGR